ncbi:agmatine deiminase family protein [Dapis sp. BLCC M172]|uniref:agmatine deiminase family protein n=1 Tax=Dapis sp. BLCC M172 TaxID=2975281 RepID=UPI003CF21425
MNRRSFLQLMATTSGLILSGKSCATFSTANSQLSNNISSSMLSNYSFFMPDEAEPHLCTWMAFSASADIWGRKYSSGVQDNLARIAKAIVKYEPVKMLVREEDYKVAVAKCGTDVELIVCPIDDLWMRDTGCVFVVNDAGEKAAIDFNFNGWGNKQYHDRDAKVARFVAKQSGVPLINTDLVFEGGGIEVDGNGTAIVTESCIINDNRNPGWSKADCKDELKYLLGLRKIIWLPGIRGYDITDGHTDFYARFARPGVVVAGYDPDPNSFDHAVTKKHLEILRSATDADGNKLEVVVLEGPKKIRPGYETDDFAAGYINFYVINGAVIAPEFGDRQADKRAKETLAELFPGRDIVQINIDEIAAGGGGIHCTTQQEAK